MFLKIFYGILLFALGIAVLKYRKTVLEWTGKMAWAERNIGSGGTMFLVILLGMFLLFLSIAYPAGVFDDNGMRRGRGIQGFPAAENTQGNSTPNTNE